MVKSNQLSLKLWKFDGRVILRSLEGVEKRKVKEDYEGLWYFCLPHKNPKSGLGSEAKPREQVKGRSLKNKNFTNYFAIFFKTINVVSCYTS